MSIMFDPGDQWTSYDVGVGEFYRVNRYKELCWPLFGDLIHILIGQFVIGMQLLLTFIPEHSDINKVLIYMKLC
jgi:hypothetical protein